MTTPKRPGLRFDNMEQIEAAAGLMAMLLPDDHPMHAILGTVTMLAERANNHPDCSECTALVGFAAMALKRADMNDLGQLDELCAATSTALSLYNHDAS
jgi:hypothetical protein